MAAIQISPQRQIIKMLLITTCELYKPWQSIHQDKKEMIVRRIERNCFEVTINQCIIDGIDRLFTNRKFLERYSSICFKVISNLKGDDLSGSIYLLDGLLSGKIDPYKIADMSSGELRPESSMLERKAIEIRQKQKIPMKVSRVYVCSKCKGNETVYQEYQGRAADESSSKSVKCIQEGCGHIWRIH